MLMLNRPELLDTCWRIISASVTKKRLRANRKNAQKSSGPKTQEGKRMASENGVKHGLDASGIVFGSSTPRILSSPVAKETLQKNINVTRDPHKMGTLKNEETNPTPRTPPSPKHAPPQPLATTAAL